ncbi:hypothetical protein [Mitsuaria sp. GD03876]|uniref:hypothetical protein n=1 Tax=Mitsuaria sp. GD03876 TaxID=2975399 RepID=UPI002449993E|nr:hypothetical protein [Mitsuaria sp. GD03876]MDH0867295.1 hypothetical protein [Mitsuaria sp. GD03876]
MAIIDNGLNFRDAPPAYDEAMAGLRKETADGAPSYWGSVVDKILGQFEPEGPDPARQAGRRRSMLALLTAMERLAEAEPGSAALRLRAPVLLSDRMVEAMTALVPEGVDEDPGAPRRKGAVRRETACYVTLVTGLLRTGLLSRERAVTTLCRSPRRDRPPFLLKLASGARGCAATGDLLGQLVIEIAPPRRRARLQFRQWLLWTKHPGGLSIGSRGTDFFSRLIQDGRLLPALPGDPVQAGVLACLTRLAEDELVPSFWEVVGAHSLRRAMKFRRAGQDLKLVRSCPPGEAVSARTPPRVPSPEPARSMPPAPPAPPAPRR